MTYNMVGTFSKKNDLAVISPDNIHRGWSRLGAGPRGEDKFYGVSSKHIYRNTGTTRPPFSSILLSTILYPTKNMLFA